MSLSFPSSTSASGHAQKADGALNVNIYRPLSQGLPHCTDLWRKRGNRAALFTAANEIVTPMREASPSGEHTHLTWPSVHAVSTSFGPYKSLHHCRGAYWTSSHLPTDGSRQHGLTMRTVCAETLRWSRARCRPDKDEHKRLLKCFPSALDMLEFPLVKD